MDKTQTQMNPDTVQRLREAGAHLLVACDVHRGCTAALNALEAAPDGYDRVKVALIGSDDQDESFYLICLARSADPEDTFQGLDAKGAWSNEDWQVLGDQARTLFTLAARRGQSLQDQEDCAEESYLMDQETLTHSAHRARLVLDRALTLLPDPSL